MIPAVLSLQRKVAANGIDKPAPVVPAEAR
jgi:hypothetical protein